jgi:hypothetical protein
MRHCCSRDEEVVAILEVKFTVSALANPAVRKGGLVHGPTQGQAWLAWFLAHTALTLQATQALQLSLAEEGVGL